MLKGMKVYFWPSIKYYSAEGVSFSDTNKKSLDDIIQLYEKAFYVLTEIPTNKSTRK